MFLKKKLCFENTYVLNIPAFEKSKHPPKITFCTYSPEILASFPSSQTNFSTVCNFKVSNCCPSWFRRSWNERWNGRRHVLVGGFNLSEKYQSNWIISPSRDEHIVFWNHRLHLVFVCVCWVQFRGALWPPGFQVFQRWHDMFTGILSLCLNFRWLHPCKHKAQCILQTKVLKSIVHLSHFVSWFDTSNIPLYAYS